MSRYNPNYMGGGGGGGFDPVQEIINVESPDTFHFIAGVGVANPLIEVLKKEVIVPAGLIRGKVMNLGTSITGTTLGTTDVLTDGDDLTSHSMKGNPSFAWVTIPSSNISAFRIKSDGDMYIRLLKGSTEVYLNPAGIAIDGRIVEITPLTGITKVAFSNQSATAALVYEFDVFDTLGDSTTYHAAKLGIDYEYYYDSNGVTLKFLTVGEYTINRAG